MKILLVIVLGKFCLNTAKVENEQAVLKGDFQSITNALNSYKVTSGDYPSTEQGLKALTERPKIAPIPKRWIMLMDEEPIDLWNRKYQYKYEDNKIQLWSKGPNLEDPKDDIYFPPAK